MGASQTPFPSRLSGGLMVVFIAMPRGEAPIVAAARGDTSPG